MDRKLIVQLLFIAAFICFGMAWFQTAGWLFDNGNATAWAYAGLTVFAAGFLMERL